MVDKLKIGDIILVQDIFMPYNYLVITVEPETTNKNHKNQADKIEHWLVSNGYAFEMLLRSKKEKL